MTAVPTPAASGSPARRDTELGSWLAGLRDADLAEVVGRLREAELPGSVLARVRDLDLPAGMAGLGGTLADVLDEARDRGAGAVDALLGRTPPVRRWWPWAVLAAGLGAAAGALTASVVRGWSWPDAPGAQEPEDLQAVVDVRVPEQSSHD